jgi:murein DD-endopeptidase MepM/ murein hydrolase activator NlpD
VVCDPAPGTVFPIGLTVVTCRARDAAGNAALPVDFGVNVSLLAEPSPTEATGPTETARPTETPTEGAMEEPTEGPTQDPTWEPEPTEAPTGTPAAEPAPAPTDEPWPSEVPAPSALPSPAAGEWVDPDSTAALPTATSGAAPTETWSPPKTPQPSATATVPATPTAEALELPWPPPDAFVLDVDGGPVGLLASVWGNEEYPISQEFGHTDFSVAHPGWYAYGLGYGLDGYEHTGLDVGMPAGTPLYSPVEGTVAIAGGTPYFTFYGNGRPGVGELLIRTADGDEVVLGHMGRIAVEEGDRVKIGQFVGLSGGENGDHLHLEVRELQPLGGYRIVDPRKSFVVKALDAAAKERDEDGQPRYRTLALALEREGAVGEATNAKYAEITVRRVNCAVDEAGSAAAACGDAVLAGASFTVYNPSNHGTTRVTDPEGLTHFGPRAGENVVEKALGADDFAGAYVSCVAQSDGRVLFEGAIAEPSIALETEPGEVIVCDWYNLAAGTTVD